MCVSDSSKYRKLSRQALATPQVILGFISNKYSGNAYWAYHIYFLEKAAEYEPICEHCLLIDLCWMQRSCMQQLCNTAQQTFVTTVNRGITLSGSALFTLE